MKTILIKTNHTKAIVHLCESKAICPYCERPIPFDEIEKKYMKQDKPYIRIKCKCKRFIGVTADMCGDFVAFELKKSNQ